MIRDPSQRIAVDFIARHVDLFPAEIARGYRLGYVDEQDVVHLAELATGRRNSCPPPLQELSLLLSDEMDRVPELIDQLEKDSPAVEVDASRVWLFLVLSRLWERGGRVSDALDGIEQIYADFGYPDEIQAFIPFLPAPEGARSGTAALESRWLSYLEDRQREFAHRAKQPEG